MRIGEHISQHFLADDFICRCGQCDNSDIQVHLNLLNLLELVYSELGYLPEYISSGVRCVYWNEHEGGSKNSWHLPRNNLAYAADCHYKKEHLDKIWTYMDKLTDIGLGRYNTFLHVDVRGYAARWDNRSKDKKGLDILSNTKRKLFEFKPYKPKKRGLKNVDINIDSDVPE